MTLLVLPDAGLVLVDHLRGALTGHSEPHAVGVKVGTTVNLKTLPFVQIRVIGGVQVTEAHDAPRADFLVWHTNDERRMDLALLCRALMRAAVWAETPTGRLCFANELLRPRTMPDPADDAKQVVMFTQTFLVR